MLNILCLLVSLAASLAGNICGIGGGVIIKPVLDATGALSISQVNFLSAGTVLCMSVISVFHNGRHRGMLEIAVSTPLAVGGIAGGVLGKVVFEALKTAFGREVILNVLQSALLILITLGSMLYSIYSERIATRHVQNIGACLLCGVALGAISSFLGIGGGPINITVLLFFFSMDGKKAAANSLYIIMFSQLAGLIQTCATGKVPVVGVGVLAAMAGAGVLGGVIGDCINSRISEKQGAKLFVLLMLVIVGINLYNIAKFAALW